MPAVAADSGTGTQNRQEEQNAKPSQIKDPATVGFCGTHGKKADVLCL
jgi:hypothetical protein